MTDAKTISAAPLKTAVYGPPAAPEKVPIVCSYGGGRYPEGVGPFALVNKPPCRAATAATLPDVVAADCAKNVSTCFAVIVYRGTVGFAYAILIAMSVPPAPADTALTCRAVGTTCGAAAICPIEYRYCSHCWIELGSELGNPGSSVTTPLLMLKASKGTYV
jgi:hypothetical protein